MRTGNGRRLRAHGGGFPQPAQAWRRRACRRCRTGTTSRSRLPESELFNVHRRDLQRRPRDFGQDFLSRALGAVCYTSQDYIAAHRRWRQLRRAMEPVYERFDILIAPRRQAPRRASTRTTPRISGSIPASPRPFDVTGGPRADGDGRLLGGRPAARRADRRRALPRPGPCWRRARPSRQRPNGGAAARRWRPARRRSARRSPCRRRSCPRKASCWTRCGCSPPPPACRTTIMCLP